MLSQFCDVLNFLLNLCLTADLKVIYVLDILIIVGNPVTVSGWLSG